MDMITLGISLGSESGDSEDLEARVAALEDYYGRKIIEDLEVDDIEKLVKAGEGKKYFPVGTQFIVPWKDNDGTSYDVANNVVHHEQATILKDGQETAENIMLLEWDKQPPTAIPFCASQALQTFDGTEGTPNGLPAGTYAFYIKDFHTDWKDARAVYYHKYLSFTLTKAVPAGGQLRGAGIANSASGWKIRSYSNEESTTIIEEVVLTINDSLPDGATFLGETWGADVGYGKLNHIEAVAYGDNTWRDSDLRMWLNSENEDGTWWVKKTRYSVRPSVYTRKSFLYGLEPKLKAKLKLVKVQAYSSYVKGDGSLITTYDKVFLHSNRNMNARTDDGNQWTSAEGSVWDFYKELAKGCTNLNSDGSFKIWTTYDILKRYPLNSNASRSYFGRSARRGYACGVFYVGSTGGVSSGGAFSGSGCLPACAI